MANDAKEQNIGRKSREYCFSTGDSRAGNKKKKILTCHRVTTGTPVRLTEWMSGTIRRSDKENEEHYLTRRRNRASDTRNNTPSSPPFYYNRQQKITKKLQLTSTWNQNQIVFPFFSFFPPHSSYYRETEFFHPQIVYTHIF